MGLNYDLEDANIARQIARERLREDVAMQAAVETSHAEIHRIERRALRLLEAALSAGAHPLDGLASILVSPGLPHARSFARRARQPEVVPKAWAADGSTSFHFKITRIGPGGELAARLRHGPGTHRTSLAALRHQRYVERAGAVEMVGAATPSSPATESQGYIEAGLIESTPASIPASWGSLSQDPAERLRFWHSLEQRENSQWVTVEADFSDLARWEPLIGEAIRQHPDLVPVLRALVEAAHRAGASKARKIRVSEDAAVAIYDLAASVWGADHSIWPMRLEPGRPGRVQTRIVVELPHELSPAARLSIGREFCAEFDRQGLPFWAVIHRPDEKNDRRNYHLHVNLSERPAQQVIAPAGTRQAGELVWDFEVAQDVRTQCRHRTTRYPLTQNKSRALNARDWPQRERERLAAIVNRELERAGVDRRYDPRTYAAMGIRKSARKSLSVDDFRREQRGEITEAGVKQAALLWAREHSKTAHKAARLQQEIDTLEAKKPTRGMESDEHWALNMRRWENQLLRMRLNREIMLKNLARNRLESRSRLVPDARRSPCDRLVLHMADSMTQEIEALKLRCDEAKAASSAAIRTLAENAARFKAHLRDAYAARAAARRPAQNAAPIPVIETPLPEPPPVMEVIPPEVAKSAAEEQKRARDIRRQVMFARQRGGGGRGD